MLQFVLAFAQLTLQVVNGLCNGDFKSAMTRLCENQWARKTQTYFTNHPFFRAGGILFLKQDLCTNEKVIFVKKFLESFLLFIDIIAMIFIYLICLFFFSFNLRLRSS